MGELIDKAKGKANQIKGDITGNDADVVKGKAQELKGDVKGGFERVKENVKRGLEDKPEDAY
jgi:uncharacterized protein YjbJ (UPF0337 family)